MHHYRGRYVITALLFVLELPVFVGLAAAALVTRLAVLVASLLRRSNRDDARR